MPRMYDYDAIIIGAGISGLVCGCYLAKSGLKTLIVEKNASPGGYCTSFRRGGFHFDACVHSLGSFREGGNNRMIFRELGLEDRMPLMRYDPSDIIIAPDHKIHFWNDMARTIGEFQDSFPEESVRIKEFFNFMHECEGLSFSSLRSITFQALLDRYFSDNRLKAILSLPLLGNAGLPSKRISAVTGVLIYKEFMFDGGYYPNGSIQVFADILAERFKEFGGEIYFSCSAKKVRVNDRKVAGVEIGNRGFYSSEYVISNADATYTYLSLLGEEVSGEHIVGLLKKMEPSLSAFVLYLGTDGKLENICSDSVLWYMPHYDMDKIYNTTMKGMADDLDWFLAKKSSEHNSLFMFVNVPFIKENYWLDNKSRLIDVYIKNMEKVFPDLSSHVTFKDAATPKTLNKWTLNYEGAAYGWARTPSQFAVTGFTQTTGIENFYLTGHWTTLFQGVAGVAYVGRDTSKKILKKVNSL